MDVEKNSGGYDAEFNPPLTDDFTCCICFLAFREPIQLECGHQYCKSCLDKYIETVGEQLSCPIDKEKIDITKVFPDKAMQRRVLSLNVNCNNSGNLCEWRGELRSLEKHIASCTFDFINCTNDECQISILQCCLDDHLSNECNFRSLACNFCGENYTYKDEQHHNEKCECYPLECTNLCGQLYIPRQEMDIHLKTCELSILPCIYMKLGCPFKGTTNERKIHEQDDIPGYLMIAMEKISFLERKVEDSHKRNIVLEERMELYEKAFAERNELFENDTNERMLSLEQKSSEIMYLCDDKMKTLNAVLEKSNETHREEAYKDMLQSLENRSTVLERRKDTPIQLAYREAKILRHGVFVWTIDDYKSKLEAEKISNDGLYSKLFLSSQQGYVLRLVIYLNGWGSGKGSHLGLCIQVGKGPNDEILDWPFACKMRLSILHPTDETKHKSKIRNPNLKHVGIVNCSFFRPTSEYNIPNGLRYFISHESMINNGFLCDDTIHVMCKIIG